MVKFQCAQSVLLVIDIQEKLAPHIHNIEAVVANTRRMIRAAKLLKLPIILTEQYPEGIGPTVPALKAELVDVPAIAKRAFSCWREPVFQSALESTGKKQIILTGIETHVCIYQTCADLLSAGFNTQIISDAVASRTDFNRTTGLNRLAAAGADITSVESCLFELLETSARPEFRQILAIVK